MKKVGIECIGLIPFVVIVSTRITPTINTTSAFSRHDESRARRGAERERKCNLDLQKMREKEEERCSFDREKEIAKEKEKLGKEENQWHTPIRGLIPCKE
jgi:hypothetical protein